MKRFRLKVQAGDSASAAALMLSAFGAQPLQRQQAILGLLGIASLPDVFDAREHLLGIARAPVDRESLDYEELDRSVRLIRVLRDATSGSIIELEDSDYDWLVTKLKATRWMSADERTSELVHTILNATSDVLD